MPKGVLNTHFEINQASTVQTRTCGPAIKMLNMPITAPSEPFWMYSDNIANGRERILAQPIPASPISSIIALEFVVNAIKMYAKAMLAIANMCTFLFPNFVDNIPIGIDTRKHIKLKIAKQIEEKKDLTRKWSGSSNQLTLLSSVFSDFNLDFNTENNIIIPEKYILEN